MPMNPNRRVYGRMIVNKDVTDLGNTEFRRMLERIYETYLKSDRGNGRVRITIDFSDEPITADLDPIKRLEMEFQPEFSGRDEPSEYEGLTLGQIADAHGEKVFMRWQHIACNPVNQLTVTADEISSARQEFESKYPGWLALGVLPDI